METLTKVGGVTPMFVHEGVSVIDICDLMESLFGPQIWGAGPGWDEEVAAVKKWVTENDAHYYSHEKQGYNPVIGAIGAKHAGKTVVVVENMS